MQAVSLISYVTVCSRVSLTCTWHQLHMVIFKYAKGHFFDGCLTWEKAGALKFRYKSGKLVSRLEDSGSAF